MHIHNSMSTYMYAYLDTYKCITCAKQYLQVLSQLHGHRPLDMHIAYCIVTCSCISINIQVRCMHNICHMHLWGCICTWEHLCALHKHAAHDQWWSKLSHSLELQLFFHCCTECAHVSMLLLSMLYTEQYFVQFVSFMLDNTQRPKRLLQCVHSTHG